MYRTAVATKLGKVSMPSKQALRTFPVCRLLSTAPADRVTAEATAGKVEISKSGPAAQQEKVRTSACGDDPHEDHLLEDDDEMEQEEMFVQAHESFEHKTAEWGGPRRGGRLPEPTRFGDWERKGRCSDF